MVIDFDSIVSEIKILENPDSSIVVGNIDALQKKYPEDNLVQIYNHCLTICNNQDILMHLITCIDKHRDKASMPFVLDLLLNKDNSVQLRSMCAKQLANFKDTSVVTPLLYCLNDKDEHYRIRLACADALGKVGDKYAVAPLINIVQDEEEKSVYVRESAAIALGMIGDLRAVDPLVSILEAKKGFIDKFTFLKERVIEVLGKFHFSSERVFKALEHTLKDESSLVRINAIEALMDYEDDRALPLIKEMLQDRDDEVKKNALIALYNMIGSDILVEVLSENSYNEFLKQEAQNIIDEYETEDDE